MPRFITLLRGVNVGKGKRVPMAEFKAMLAGLGHTDVSTLLNSGNAVFTSTRRSTSAHAAAIAAALEKTMGVATPVIVKSGTEWSAIRRASPVDVPEADHSKYLVAVAADVDALRGLEPLAALAEGSERFVVTPVAAFLHCPDGILQSRVGEALLGKAGRDVTTRNWATVLKLAVRLEAASG